VPTDCEPHDASPLLIQVAGLLPPGRALDLACGTGRHALHLARLGWQVTAVDISAEAIRQLRATAKPGLAIDARVADLEKQEFTIEPAAYDLICDFYYLQRDLFPQIREGVRPGGAVVAAIHLTGRFALESGELRALFAGWKILYYSEPPAPRPTACIIARKA
jgi:tellurite methyltransferase